MQTETFYAVYALSYQVKKSFKKKKKKAAINILCLTVNSIAISLRFLGE